VVETMPSDIKTPYAKLLQAESPSLRPSSHSPSASRTASPVPLPPDDQLQDHYAYSTQLHRREPESIVDFSSSSHSAIPLINDLKHAAQRFTSYDPPTSATSSHSSASTHSNNQQGGGGGGVSYPPQHAASASTSYSHHPFAHTTSPLTPSAHFATLSIPQTLSALSSSSSSGLDAQKVPAIRELSGPNEFEVDAKEPTWKKFLGKFIEDPLILLLLASACVSAVVGNYDDAASILVAVFIVITGALRFFRISVGRQT
jgi:Ca2+-transporting ATPase